jgi:calcium permeable stress-gated cation channel
MPKIWLAQDSAGTSEQEIEKNEAAGIPTTDQAASLDSKNHIIWSQEDDIPIARTPVEY